jgi:hypothetical protein
MAARDEGGPDRAGPRDEAVTIRLGRNDCAPDCLYDT